MAAFQPKNIIFDFGGVIINTSIDRIAEKLALPKSGMASAVGGTEFNALVREFESGRISAEAFGQKACTLLGVSVPPTEFESIWNSMLLDIPPANIGVLRRARQHYGIYLLSNTNITHYNCFEKMFEQAAGAGFDKVFDKAYFSHKLGMVKPDSEIFEHVMKAEGLNAHETLFIDDNISNIKSAAELGIVCCWLANGLSLVSVFDTDGLFAGPVYRA